MRHRAATGHYRKFLGRTWRRPTPETVATHALALLAVVVLVAALTGVAIN